jgi:hypothetical protein
MNGFAYAQKAYHFHALIFEVIDLNHLQIQDFVNGFNDYGHASYRMDFDKYISVRVTAS